MALFSGKSKTQTQVDPMRRDLTLDWQNRLAALSRRPMEFFPEQTYAEFQPEQQEALGMREQYARGMAEMMDPTMAAWESTLGAPNVAENPYVQGMLEQQRSQVMRGLSEAMPGLQANMLGVNERLGGTGQGVAAGIMGRGAMEALASQAAQTQMDAYSQGLAQQRYGLSAAPGMMQMGMMPSDILMGVGDVRRAEEQRAIDEARQRFEFEQEEPWRRMERYIGTYEPMSRPYSTTETQEKYTPSALQIAGQLGGLAMGGMGLFDEFSNLMGSGGYTGPTTPAMSPYQAPAGLGSYFEDIAAYQPYRRR